MYVPQRTASAYIVAASQDKEFKGCNVFVESGCDCRFWKTFLDGNVAKIRACSGWPEVLNAVRDGNVREQISIGIIDRDFRDYTDNYEEAPENVFVSDQHDVELMIIKAEGIYRVINNYDASDHIANYERKEGKSVLDAVFEITDKIGILKLIDRREQLNFKLRKAGKGNDFDLPKYENFLDKKGHFISDEKMIDYLIDWSKDNKSFPNRSRDEILKMFKNEKIEEYDSYLLSSGHDVSYMIAYLIWKHISGEKTDKEEIEKLLRTSFTNDSFHRTRLYTALSKWSRDNKMALLL